MKVKLLRKLRKKYPLESDSKFGRACQRWGILKEARLAYGRYARKNKLWMLQANCNIK